MADITERLRELSKARLDKDAWERETTVRIPAEPDRDIDLVLSNAAAEIDRLRARVAELEAARGEPVAWIFKSPYRLFLHFGRPRPESVPLYTAPPASTVNVDAISDDRIQSGSEAYFAECSQLGITGEQSADIYMRCMRAALRAIFNKGE